MALTYNQIDAITEKFFIPKLIDNVFDTNALVKRLTRPNYLKVRTGGLKIVAPIINSKPTSGGYYENYDEHNTSPTDNMTAAEFDWKQLYEAIRISRAEILKNSGDAEKLSLVASKTKIAEYNFKENLALGLFSDGTASTGALTTKQITGLRLLLSTSETYGGIAVADMATWIATVKDNSSTNRALTLNLLQQALGAATFDTAKPSVFVMKQDVYDQLWALFQPHQRLMSSEMTKLGFENILTFNGIPCLVDSHMKANSIFGIDEENVFLNVMRDENMRVETVQAMETSNTMLKKIYWMGNLSCHSRRTNLELADIEVAS